MYKVNLKIRLDRLFFYQKISLLGKCEDFENLNLIYSIHEQLFAISELD